MKNLQAVESLVIVYLSLLFGFRPVTIVKMDLQSIERHGEGYALTEAFRKGYTAKHVPKRRMIIPWSDFPDVKFLFEHYFNLVSNAKTWSTINTAGSASTEVLKCLKLCEKEFGMKLP